VYGADGRKRKGGRRRRPASRPLSSLRVRDATRCGQVACKLSARVPADGASCQDAMRPGACRPQGARQQWCSLPPGARSVAARASQSCAWSASSLSAVSRSSSCSAEDDG
jgi:hypothetical protein